MEEVNIKNYLRLFKTGWKTLVVIPLIAIITSGILSFYVIKPTYQATATVLVQQERNDKVDNEYNTLLANKELIKTYIEIAQSRRVMEKVKEIANLDISDNVLQNKIKVTSLGESQILDFKIEDKDAKLAAKLANIASTTFITEVQHITGLDNVKLVDKAYIPDKPINPQKLLNMIVAAIVGIISAIGIILVRDYLDVTIKEAKEIEEQFKLPVLGIIPVVKDKQSLRLISMYERGIAKYDYSN